MLACTEMYFLFYFLCFVLQTVFLFICLIENSCLGDQTGESLLNINTAENYGKKAIKNTKSSGSLPPGKTVIVFMPRGKLTGKKKNKSLSSSGLTGIKSTGISYQM